MSIPERMYRIFKYKLNEMKDHFDRLDAEAQRDWEADPKRAEARSRADARQELNDALSGPSPETAKSQPYPYPEARTDLPSQPYQPTRRTPQEIAAGVRPPGVTAIGSAPTETAAPDPLLYHYRALGVEPGSDFPTVQAAYNRLAARCEPSRFPAGSEEERQAQEIRKRLETSYKALREALDTTTRRFDLLEFDSC